MEKVTFYTLFKKDHKLGGNLYVRGRVHGLMEAICYENPGKDILQGMGEVKAGFAFITVTTKERYDKFSEIIELEYPGLCIFDYKES